MKMPKETYCLPIKVEIQWEEPDVAMREISETIYDAINSWSLANVALRPGRMLNVEWSIYKKPDPKTFGQQVTGK